MLSFGQSGNLISNPSCEDALVGGNIPNWTEVTGSAWTRAAYKTPQDGAFHFTVGNSDTPAELRQDIDVSSYSAEIDSITQQFEFTGYVRDWADQDSSRVIVEYRNSDNSTVLDTYDSGNIANSSSWQQIGDTKLAPVGTRFIRVRLLAKKNSGGFNDGYFDDLSLIALAALPVDRSTNLILNPSCDDALVGGNIPNWTEVTGSAWTRAAYKTPQDGAFHFTVGNGDTPAELCQSIDVSRYSAEIDNSQKQFEFTGYVRDWADQDSSRVIVEYRNSDNSTVLDTYDSGNIANSSSWQQISDTKLAPVGTRYIKVRLLSTSPCCFNDGYYDDLSLIALTSLPVELIYFTAQMKDSHVLIKWKTGAEINNDYFLVQKSVDGINWETIANVQGAGNSTEPIEYSYTDSEIQNEVIYYRIIQFDFDGTSETFKTVVVNTNKKTNEFNLTIYPQPIENIAKINFKVPDDGLYNFKIYDIVGKVIYSSKLVGIKGENWFEINMATFNPGTYIFSLSDNNGRVITQKAFTQ